MTEAGAAPLPAEGKHRLPYISASFLVLGNVLGVGVLAMPVRAGLAGFVPAMCGIVAIWFVMLVSAWVIAYRLGKQEHFDIPSFYQQELGGGAKWVAVACNLLLLYGVLTAYLSGVSDMIESLFRTGAPQWVVMVIYFAIVSTLILLGTGIMRRGNCFIIAAIWIAFILMIATGSDHFREPTLLSTYKWNFIPIGLPIAVSAFHFHNIIPTVCRAMKHDQKATRRAILLGVTLGLLINVLWIAVVLGTLPETGPGPDTIMKADRYSWTANVPMSKVLHSPVFKVAGLVFALLAVTSSYVANGTGLFNFVKDLTYTYFHTDNRFLAGLLAFLPPLVVGLIYPDIFLDALTMVGGVGETTLFVILPGFILARLTRRRNKVFFAFGCLMCLIGVFILLFVIAHQAGWVPDKYIPLD